MSSKKELGNLGENLAKNFLIKKNYLILAKNYYIKGGEIDLIAKDPDTREIVFVEVKTRTSNEYGWPEQAVNETKRLRLTKTAEKYLRNHNYSFKQNYRFDILAIELNLETRRARIQHFKNS